MEPSHQIPPGTAVSDPASVLENGRTYNGYKPGKYLLPNDGEEQDRLDLQHEMFLVAMDGQLGWAPVNKPKKVLDIGTGTGIWAIQFAERHPTSRVTGTDISLIQPANTPSNCTFIREDADDEWSFDKASLDYIHWRLIWLKDQKSVMRKVFDHLVPGGWAEFQDSFIQLFGVDEAAETTLRSEPAGIFQFTERALAGAKAFGLDFRAAQHYKKWMQEIGFVDVVEKQIRIPSNGWPQDEKQHAVGRLQEINALNAIEGGSMKLLQAAGMTKAEIHEFLIGVRRSVQDRSVGSYFPVYIVYGRKPSQGEAQS